jgi:hypothetical protein
VGDAVLPRCSIRGTSLDQTQAALTFPKSCAKNEVFEGFWITIVFLLGSVVFDDAVTVK